MLNLDLPQVPTHRPQDHLAGILTALEGIRERDGHGFYRNKPSLFNFATQSNRILRGWAAYFNYGSRKTAYRAIDNYVYQGVLDFLKRRSQVRSRGTRRVSFKEVYGELGVLRLRRIHLP